MAPPSLTARKIPDNPFRCDRLIQFRGKTLPCDSALRRDGESLRAIFEKAKATSSIEELDAYQTGRSQVRYSAYVGTAGLLIAATGGVLANIFIDSSRPTARQDTAKVLRFSGIGLTVGSVIFGLSALRSNESHLQNAIIQYNASQPDKPISILFKSDF
ncbi:MAG: hypothetical protein JST04_12220 [Bdellovibrionales bacterium]|nr:hypothetical protein [Bdellovibrionales bacterium]